MANGPLKIQKGTPPVLIQATRRHTTTHILSSIGCYFVTAVNIACTVLHVIETPISKYTLHVLISI